MAFVQDTTTSHDISTNAGFRAWGQAISNALSTVGLVKTADTGQIDWTTVNTPGADSTDAGYEVWRFDDSEQGTSPVFVKFHYGRGFGAANPRLRLQVGLGSNGSGTLTTPSQILAAPISSGANNLIYVVHGLGELFIFSGGVATSNTSNGNCRAWVGRLRRPGGQIIGPGVFCTSAISGQFLNAQFSFHRDGVWQENSDVACADEPSNAVGGEQVLGRARLRTRPAQPLRVLLFTVGLADNDTGSVDVAGAARQFKVLPTAHGFSGTAGASTFVMQLLVLNE